MIDPYAHHRAVDSFPNWVEKDFQLMFPEFSNNLIKNDNIVYQNKEEFCQYKDKILMLVGGGPSSKNINWKNLNYDFLWTMNQFYRSSILQDTKVDLAMIMGETNIADETFLEKTLKDDTLIGFESHDRWLNYDFKNTKNYFCMHTKFYGKIGIGARMKIFACELGFKKVYFTGFDGPEEVYLGNHAFEPGKKTLPSIFSGQPLNVVSFHHKLQYDYLWKSIKKKYPFTNFENLGLGGKYHEECR